MLIIDDDDLLCRGLQRMLRQQQMDVHYVTDSRSALVELESFDPDVVLLDVMMPHKDGLQTLAELRRSSASCEVVVMTASTDKHLVVEAMKAGAYHFITKPFPHETLYATLLKAIELKRLRDRRSQSDQADDGQEPFGELVGRSSAMRAVFDTIEQVAASPSTVLLFGESGTGKELVARAIHQRSARAKEKFVAVNCAAIPNELIESELFGHVRGAFSGAMRDRAGLFETAGGGSIFLDEIGDMPLAAQAKLLRVVQEGELKRVGADETKQIDVRVIAATNVDLAARVVEGAFRRDLYYRLNVIALELPPLRHREGDVPILVEHFVKKLARRLSRPAPTVDEAALRTLCAYEWPGNVRELEHVLERAFLLSRGGVIDREDLSIAKDVAVVSEPASDQSSAEIVPYAEAKRRALLEFERAYAIQLLAAADGNISQAARLAGVDRTNVKRLLRRAGVSARGLQSKD